MATVVYTVLIGGYDELRPALFPEQADYICFSDQLVEVSGWQYRPAPESMQSSRRRSRIPKIAPQKHLREYDVSLYHDANFQLLENPVPLCEKWLGKTNIALFRHPERDCLYDEIVICEGFKLDTPARFSQQRLWCEAAGMPRHWGLFQASVIVRRHMSEKLKAFTSTWISEYNYGSCRDQISLAFALWQAGVEFSTIPGAPYTCPSFRFRGH